jgi:Stringent starvation protein B
VNALAGEVEVPQKYVNKEGQIVLNIAPRAVASLEIGNKAVVFNARFGGIPTDIYVPCHAVLGIYARENGQGMMFESELPTEPDPSSPDEGSPSEPARRPSLRVVK